MEHVVICYCALQIGMMTCFWILTKALQTIEIELCLVCRILTLLFYFHMMSVHVFIFISSLFYILVTQMLISFLQL